MLSKKVKVFGSGCVLILLLQWVTCYPFWSPVAQVEAAGTLPTPWQTTDIGVTGNAGGAMYNEGIFTLSSVGTDLWGTSDKFQYVYQPLEGNGTVITRVTSLPATDDWAKAGVMIRETLNANAKHADMLITTGNGADFQYRSAIGGETQDTTVAAILPVWLKLTRSGNSFTGYVSENGTEWTLAGQTTISMSSQVYIGLALSNPSTSEVNTASFQEVNVAEEEEEWGGATVIDLIRGHNWNDFSGASTSGDEVIISGIGRAIVPLGDKATQASVSNPPINLRGPYLNVPEEFSISYQINAPTDKHAAIHFYGTLPIIQDEWRQEGKTVIISLKSGKLYVTVNNGTSAMPKKGTYSFNASGMLDVRMLKKSGKITFFVNNVKIGELTDPGIFKSGKVFFGADADIGSSFTLKSLTAKAESGTGNVTAGDLQISQIDQNSSSLRMLAQANAPHLKIGTAATVIPMMTDMNYTHILGREFSMITPENEMKFQFIHPQRDQYAFAEADALVEFAMVNGLDIHGHTLVWSEANPRWVTQGNYSKAEIQTIMKEHIATVVGRYKGKIKEWDVINEPLKDESFDVNLGLRESVWFRALGEQFMDNALRAAHEADPDAKLYINEYGCEADDEKADALYILAQRLLSRGVPLHGIGFQLHEDIGKDSEDTYTPITANEFKRTLKRFTDLGLDVRVSEMDVNMHGNVTNTLRDQQANYFKSMLQVTKQNTAFTSFSMWGFTDLYSSLQPHGEYNVFGNGLIYNEKYLPKKGYQRLNETLQTP